MWFNITKKEKAILREDLKKFLGGFDDDEESENCLHPKDCEMPGTGRTPDHECEEGMTELNGYFICKHCGINLRKIK